MQKVVHPDEKMDDWEKVNETSLPEKEDFYRHLNMEDITNAKILCTQKVFVKILKLKILEICALKYMKLIPLVFFQILDYHGKQLYKRLK